MHIKNYMQDSLGLKIENSSEKKYGPVDLAKNEPDKILPQLPCETKKTAKIQSI